MASLAARQHGAVTRVQLLAIGLTARMIDHRLAAGLLAQVHPGVYLVGFGPPAPLAHEAAAILACRPRALLSLHTAARLRRLPTPVDDGIHVTVVGRWRRSLEGVHVHTISALDDGELDRHEGLPISSPSLTLLDLAGALGPDQLGAALNEARVQRNVTDRELRATIAAHANRRGAKALGRLLDREQGPRITRSPAERRALRVMRRHGIEPDASDVPIGPYRVDFLFEAERLVVEVDGYRYHSTPRRFVDDRRRTAYLAARGLQVFPLTWDDLGPGAVLAMRRLKDTLAARRVLYAA